jgi:hypothetical protein
MACLVAASGEKERIILVRIPLYLSQNINREVGSERLLLASRYKV